MRESTTKDEACKCDFCGSTGPTRILRDEDDTMRVCVDAQACEQRWFAQAPDFARAFHAWIGGDA